MELTSPNTGPGFDIQPFVKNHPEAVFIQLTDVKEKTDAKGLCSAGEKLATELIVKVSSGGYPYSTKINIKPNWTAAGPKDGKPVVEKLGVCSDP